MRSKLEIKKMLENKSQKKYERELGIKIRNGQTTQGIRHALKWVLDNPTIKTRGN